MLITLVLQRIAELARRLLQRPAKVVSDTVSYAVIIYAVGCVIPTPLDRQPTATNYAPSIDVALSMPLFGPLTRTEGDDFDWTIYASDPNTDDTLVAVVMERRGNGSFNYVANVGFTKQPILDPSQPARWSGSTALADWCFTLKAGVHYLYAFVADRPFIGFSEKSDGLVDSNHWELTCS